MKHTFFLLLLLLNSSFFLGQNSTSIPLNGNAYITGGNSKLATIKDGGLVSWTDKETVISSWFKVTQTGNLSISLKGKVRKGKSKINLTVAGKSFSVDVSKTSFTEIPVGNVTISTPGYIRVDIKAVTKTGAIFADISDLIIKGEAANEPLYFVRDFSTYWGRRGPSVHLKYAQPKEDIEYFYNEVTVPVGDDVLASYYMANGFKEGYFGMQTNSATERRILFSVWSPYDTQNPKDIPAEYQIKNLRRGQGVHIGEFGNEGSGGQSYLKYPWKAGQTYKFLTHIHPDGKGNTIYTAYFYAADESQWRLIACFLRPKTDTWYKGAHSFLENFSPNQGYLTRKVLFSNQWVVTSKGEWIELTESTFTYDATANAKVRQDYKGGLHSDSKYFFLQNCGFFNENTVYNSKFSRPTENNKPVIDFEALKKIGGQ